MNILVSEDDEMLRLLLQDAFEREGYVAVCARNASEALTIATRHPERLDLLVTEIRLPGMDGFALSVAIREVRTDISVLLMHSEIPPDKPSFADFLRKPFTPTDLLSAVRRSVGPDAKAAGAALPAEKQLPRFR